MFGFFNIVMSFQQGSQDRDLDRKILRSAMAISIWIVTRIVNLVDRIRIGIFEVGSSDLDPILLLMDQILIEFFFLIFSGLTH